MPNVHRTSTVQLLAVLATLGSALATTNLSAQQRSQSPASSDACGLLTQQDAAAALGEAATASHVMPNTTSGGSVASACEYSGSGLHKINVSLMRIPADQVAMYRAMCADQKHDGLAGLGDVACWYQDKHEELNALKGNALVSIEINRSGDPTAAIISAMRKALERLR